MPSDERELLNTLKLGGGIFISLGSKLLDPGRRSKKRLDKFKPA